LTQQGLFNSHAIYRQLTLRAANFHTFIDLPEPRSYHFSP